MTLHNDTNNNLHIRIADSPSHAHHEGFINGGTSKMVHHTPTPTSLPHDVSVTDINLPADLEARTYEQFDRMVEKGLIYYDSTVEPEWVVDERGFQFEFRIVPSLLNKPVLSAEDPRRQSSSKGGPFINPKPEEVIEENVGPNHRLMLNKYCLYRPMLVLPTKQFAPQSDDLDASDLNAAWALLQAFSSSSGSGSIRRGLPAEEEGNAPADRAPMLVIFNGGANGGSSQGHKHLQLFPLPEDPRRRAAMWPEKISVTYSPFPSSSSTTTTNETIETNIPGVPFRHFGLKIPSRPTPTAREIAEIHSRLLAAMRKVQLEEHVTTLDYNVAFSRDWMVLIPRTWNGGSDGPFGTSAAGMLGLVAVRDQRDRERWGELGYSKYLAKLGIPI